MDRRRWPPKTRHTTIKARCQDCDWRNSHDYEGHDEQLDGYTIRKVAVAHAADTRHTVDVIRVTHDEYHGFDAALTEAREAML